MAAGCRTSSKEKNSPWWVTGAPVRSAREHPERLVRAPPTGCRVDAGDLHLVAVLTADAHAEVHPPGGELGDARELAGDENRVAQGQQVDREVDMQGGVRTEEEGRLDETVGAVPAVEADVVARHDVVEARAVERGEDRLETRGVTPQERVLHAYAEGREPDADPHPHHSFSALRPTLRRHHPSGRLTAGAYIL